MLWDTKAWQELATLKGAESFIYSVAFSPDGRTLAGGCADTTIKLWRGATDEEVARDTYE